MANKLNKTNIFDTVLNKDEHKQIENMLTEYKKNKNAELEVSFKNVDYSNFMRIVEHYVNTIDEKDIQTSNSLDISIILPDGNTYRVSILDDDEINSFIQNFTKSKTIDIQKYLLSLEPSEKYEIIFKNRGAANRIYINDLSMVFKVTEEIQVGSSKKPKLIGTEKMLYRYKERYSFFPNDIIRLDLSNVQESSDVWNLVKRPSIYEIEIEFTDKKITNTIFFDEILNVMPIVQNSPVPIGKAETEVVLREYRKLFNLKSSAPLQSRNVVSIESQHIVKFIPNKYAITEKADGERHFLYSNQHGLYLLSTNMIIKKLDLVIKPDKSNKTGHIDMVLDGELIENKNGKMFMIFDVVYANGVDYRYDTNYNLIKRLDIINGIVDQYFGTLIPFANYTDSNSDVELDSIKDFYTKQLKIYWKEFKKQLDEKTKDNGIFITRKKYFVPYGIDSSEVFMYADLVWKLLVYNKLSPYKLDGIIYTPINSPYMITVEPDKLDTVPLEYKWKNPMQNSIDFYIKYQKDALGNEAIYYDNTVVRGQGKPYKICILHVGVRHGNEERPVPFRVEGIDQKANIYLTNDEARDTEGNIIYDSTVVEFIFDTTKTDIDDAYKWIPLKTRYDKTEAVQKYKKKYGNNAFIANRIWKTIVNPVTEDTIAALADPSSYQKEIERLSKSVHGYNKQSFIYYQKKTANAAGMRIFNNWIKSNLIITYCRNKQRVLDIGCGRGGDLIKFIKAGIEEYVGIDIDNNGLYVINDSAYNRYKEFKKNIKNVQPMYFINADARGLLDVETQQNIIPNMTLANKKMISEHLSGKKKYNAINCQFSLHYFLADEVSWTNFCKNINNHLDNNGYLLITCFDGKLIYDKLLNKQKLAVSYTDNHGNKNVFFELLKVYKDVSNDKTELGLGMAIDVYNSIISNPGTYIREYLVFPEFLEKSLKKRCGLELVETDSFFNLFNLYKNYFVEDRDEVISPDLTRKKYDQIRDFYLALFSSEPSTVASDITMASFKFAMLNRYYVFKKTTMVDITEPSRIVNINSSINLGKLITPYFDTNRMVIDPSKKSRQINKIYHAIRRKYNSKPSVYIIRHTIPEDGVDETYRRNKMDFIKAKNGSDDKILLIYKSPDKYFYPISYQNIVYNDIDDYLSQGRPIAERTKYTYLLNREKIVNDLDVLVALTEKINNY